MSSCSSSSSLLLASAAAILLSFACASSRFSSLSGFDSAPAPKVSSAVLSAHGSGEVLSPVGEDEKA